MKPGTGPISTGRLPQNIDEVVERLDGIVRESRDRSSRLGYFAALYKRVTLRVREGIARGEFLDGARMERLDVAFADRYVEAYDRQAAGLPATSVWRVAFDAARSRRPIVLQHLLLGMNAHINLDLGVAAARIAPGGELAVLYDDFTRINRMLAEQTDTVKGELERVWPALRVIDRLMGRAQDAVVRLAIATARGAAWNFASMLAPLPVERQVPLIDETDARLHDLGRRILRPGPMLFAALLLVRLGERGSVPRVIDVLDR